MSTCNFYFIYVYFLTHLFLLLPIFWHICGKALSIIMKIILFALSCGLIVSCGENASKKQQGKADSSQAPVVVNAASSIPLYRDTVSNDPVAGYRVKTDNPLNDWYFSVRLYETRKTFNYLIKLEFEEISGQDTLRLPNFGVPPLPVVRKGPEKYSCIIGFMDKENQFREYKKVYVVGDRLKITALKHYAVATYQDDKTED